MLKAERRAVKMPAFNRCRCQYDVNYY